MVVVARDVDVGVVVAAMEVAAREAAAVEVAAMEVAAVEVAAGEVAAKYGVPLIPRTGGSSLVGQAVGEALIIARAVNSPDVLASALIAEYLSFWDPSTFERRVDADQHRPGVDQLRIERHTEVRKFTPDAVDALGHNDGTNREYAAPCPSTQMPQARHQNGHIYP